MLAFWASHPGVSEFTWEKIEFCKRAPFAKRSALTLRSLAMKEIKNSVKDDTIWMNSFHSKVIAGQSSSSLINLTSGRQDMIWCLSMHLDYN